MADYTKGNSEIEKLTQEQIIESGVLQEMKKCHFIGIGGIGMSALAQILLQRGYRVSGSDLSTSPIVERLQSCGAVIFNAHTKENLEGCSLVVYSTAVNEQNPEMQRAVEEKIPLLHRAELLRELLVGYQPLLVTGTHGKTSTSALLAHLLLSVELHPSYAIGGWVRSLAANGQHGKGPYFVAEADESDGSFLKYPSFGAIITNIDGDHLDFWKTEGAMTEGFRKFGHSVASSNHLFWCGDDEILRTLNFKGYSYGFGEENDLRVQSFYQSGWKMVFDIKFDGKEYKEIELPSIGGHQVLNAAAVFGMGLALNIEESLLRRGLATFQGVNRRLERKGAIDGIEIYDDYAHHPTEIRATLRALKHAIGSRRLIVFFQPHRYTRTRDCMSAFGAAFHHADLLVVTDIYGAGEPSIEGITAEGLYEEIRRQSEREVYYVPRKELVPFFNRLHKMGENDVVVSMGAGDITMLAKELIEPSNAKYA